jgi:hypothetical protein
MSDPHHWVIERKGIVSDYGSRVIVPPSEVASAKTLEDAYLVVDQLSGQYRLAQWSVEPRE